MANTGLATDAAYEIYETQKFVVESGDADAPVIKIPFEVVPSMTLIRG